MKASEFLELVSKMRKAQKDYIKTRDFKVLQESRKLEKQVDTAIEVYTTGLRLF